MLNKTNSLSCQIFHVSENIVLKKKPNLYAFHKRFLGLNYVKFGIFEEKIFEMPRHLKNIANYDKPNKINII